MRLTCLCTCKKLAERHVVLKTATICPPPGRAGEKYNIHIHTFTSCMINLAIELVRRVIRCLGKGSTVVWSLEFGVRIVQEFLLINFGGASYCRDILLGRISTSQRLSKICKWTLTSQQVNRARSPGQNWS